MNISENLSEEFRTIDIQDSMEEILEDLKDFHLNSISILENGQWIGNVQKNHFYKIKTKNWLNEIQAEMNTYKLEEEEDLLAAIPLFELTEMDNLPVVSAEGKWLGYIEINQIGKILVRTNHGSLDGGIIKLNYASERDDLTSIIRIIEENEAEIIRLFQSKTTHDLIVKNRLIIQLQTFQLEKIVKNLERHGYLVDKAFHFNRELKGSEEDNFNHLMKFLNI